MTCRTQDEIEAEIVKLREMKPTVRKVSGFGDNHHDAIDAQVKVLSEGLTIQQVHSQYGADDEETEFGMDMHFAQNVLEEAIAVVQWRDYPGKNPNPPSAGWQELAQ